jgi:hypothetical protein
MDKYINWNQLAQKSDQCQALVNILINRWVLKKVRFHKWQSISRPAEYYRLLEQVHALCFRK